jgi:hypothetical protein
MPQTFSPTVKPLTFAFTVTLDCIWCTADIKSAYLNVPRPTEEIPILTKLEPFVADICGLQLYRIDKCLYGLPNSGRHFYRHYRDALIAEGCVISQMDNSDVEKTFIVLLYVDDTLIFCKCQEDIDQFSAQINRHYELKLDAKADSFLRIHILLKLLQKLFKEHPEQGQDAVTPVRTCADTQYHNYSGTITAHTSNNVLTVTGAFDVLNQESTRHHDGRLLRGKSTSPTQDDYNQLYILHIIGIHQSHGRQGSPHIHRDQQCYTAIL